MQYVLLLGTFCEIAISVAIIFGYILPIMKPPKIVPIFIVIACLPVIAKGIILPGWIGCVYGLVALVYFGIKIFRNY